MPPAESWYKVYLAGDYSGELEFYSTSAAFDWWHKERKPGDRMVIVHYQENEVVQFQSPEMCTYLPF